MICIDVETTGTNPEKHSILSLGAVDFDSPRNQFYDECRAFPEAHIEEEALMVNGFTQEMVWDEHKKTETELLKNFIAWATETVPDWTFAAQNVAFDYEFVRAGCERGNLHFPFARRSIDVHSLAWLHMRKRGLPLTLHKHHSAISSGVIQNYCGIPDEPSPHNALTGALWHAEVISRLAYDKILLEQFIEHPIPWMKTP